MLQLLLISILCSAGIATLLVEKGHQFPMRFWHVKIRRFIRKMPAFLGGKKIGPKWKGKRFEEVVFCVTCTSFWTTLITDLLLLLVTLIYGWPLYFLWPLSGFATCFVVYVIFELINAIDRQNK